MWQLSLCYATAETKWLFFVIYSLTHSYLSVVFIVPDTLIRCWYSGEWASRMALVVKSLPANANAVDIRDVGLISG